MKTRLGYETLSIQRRSRYSSTRGHGIEGHLFGTNPQIPKFLESQDEDGHNVRIINPEFEQWNKEDQLLLSWLFSSLSTVILSQVVC